MPSALWLPSHVARWERFVREDSHVSPLHCGHAWLGYWAGKSRAGVTRLIQHDQDSALVMQQANHPQRAWWWTLDEGRGSCVLLGRQPEQMLHTLVRQALPPSRTWEMSLGRLLRNSPLYRQLQQRFPAGGVARLQEHVTGHAFCASLEGGLDGWLSRRTPRFRKNLAREVRRARAAGLEWVRICPQTRVGAAAVMRRMLAVESASWKATEEGSYSLQHHQELYSALLLRLADIGQARIVLARWQGRDVGFLFGGVVRGVFSGLHFAYDHRLAGMGVGNLLQWEAVQWLCQEGVRRYDLGIGGDGRLAYKSRWAEQSLPVVHLWLHSD